MKDLAKSPKSKIRRVLRDHTTENARPNRNRDRGRAKRLLLLGLILIGAAASAPAQWLTQSITLTQGWNAVFLHVDASYNTLDNLVGADLSNPIIEVWMWQPAATTAQFVQDPQNPTAGGSQWASWIRNNNSAATLQRLVGNAAYLVRVGTNVTTYPWALKGRPVAPQYQWTTTGLNFLGFPTVPVNPPDFYTFLSQAPGLYQNAQIFQYVGGDLGSNNPVQLRAFRTTPVARGHAYWIRAGDVFNTYFAPFGLSLANGTGVDFQDSGSTYRLRLRNLTAAALGVALHLVNSESSPAGQAAIAPLPSLLVRGSLNATNLTYDYTNLVVGGGCVWTLGPYGQPDSELEVVLGLDRSAITSPPGALLAGVLRLTDSLGFAQVDVPVKATAGSAAGLWVGNAVVSQVGEYLKSYQLDGDDSPVTDTNGAYIVNGINTNLESVAAPFALRLIIHNPAAGNALLLQQVYYGVNAATNPILTTLQSALNPSFLGQSRRISATHLPWSAANSGWSFNGLLSQSASLQTTVTLDYNDQASNPFVHNYHPDHDNLDATFTRVWPQGVESYTIRRDITLNVTPPAQDFGSLTSGGNTLSGDYFEAITILGLARGGGTDTRVFQVAGSFNLHRVSTVSTLTTSP
jgi:hypothetical protein